VGVLPRAPGGFRFLFVTIDTLIKWMEAMTVVNIMQEAAVKFLQSIIYMFGVPRWVLIDNGTQFKSKICKMLHRLWYPPSAIISSTSSDERASQTSKRTYSTRYEDKNVP
jgi:hypothetical protein